MIHIFIKQIPMHIFSPINLLSLLTQYLEIVLKRPMDKCVEIPEFFKWRQAPFHTVSNSPFLSKYSKIEKVYFCPLFLVFNFNQIFGMTIELFAIFLWRIFNLPNSNFGAKNQDVLQREFLDKNKNFRVECIILPLFINSKKTFFLFVREIDASFLNKSELIEEVIVTQRVSNMFWGVAFDMKCFTEN